MLVDYLDTWVWIVPRDDMMALRRLVIGEVDRFPQLRETLAKTNTLNDEP